MGGARDELHEIGLVVTISNPFGHNNLVFINHNKCLLYALNPPAATGAAEPATAPEPASDIS